MSNLKLFESKQIRSNWNEKDQKWFFSVQDVVEVLTDSADVKQYIKRMLSRDEMLRSNWGTICTLVEMETADGKTVIDNHFKGGYKLYLSLQRKPKALSAK